MENKVVKTMISAAALSGVAYAGPIEDSVFEDNNGCHYCETLEALGASVYEGGFINSIKFSGRAHFNAALSDVDAEVGSIGGPLNGLEAGADDGFIELRRFRFGTKIQFLNDFTFVGSADFNKDSSRDDVSFGYDSLDELYLKYTFGNLFGLEKVALAYGRQKLDFTAEGSTSSNSLKTVERSVLSNHFYQGIHATAAQVSGQSGNFKGKLGLFSSADTDELSGFSDGQAYYGSLAYSGLANDGVITLQGVWNDVDAGDSDVIGFDWATSLSYKANYAGWDLLVDGIYGKESNGDGTYGIVILPSKFIIEDKLEVVARYEYANSEGDNIELSRYAGATVSNIGVPGIGTGGLFAKRQAFYAGLNYYFCDSTKVQVGIEYEEGTSDALPVEIDATTLWFGLRTSF